MKQNEMSTEMLLDELPQGSKPDVSAAWNRLRVRMHESDSHNPIRWNPLRAWSLAAASSLAVIVALVITVAPFRAWAENLLAIFRVEHVTVLDINSGSIGGFENNQVFNQAMTHILSEDVKLSEPLQMPQRVANASTASRLAGFNVRLIAGEIPSSFMVRNTITAQMKLDRDRLQSILAEAGRGDLHIPGSVDGAVIGMRVPAGIITAYGNCGNPGNPRTAPEDATCIKLSELPSPTASFPPEIDPAEIAQVGLQAAGLSPTEADNFTQTVDWTTTLVLPVLHGQTIYENVNVNGIEAVLLRPRLASPSGRFDLVWVDKGIVYSLMGAGDDTTAINLASQIE
jgi:hypothetical protein